MFFVNFLVLLTDGHLVSFHIWLYFQEISTFDYIIYKREKREKDSQLKVLKTLLIKLYRTVKLAYKSMKSGYFTHLPRKSKRNLRLFKKLLSLICRNQKSSLLKKN